MAVKTGDAVDARFEDGFTPMRLKARDADDLAVMSALLQDAVIADDDIGYDRPQARFAFLANRFRWEAPAAQERVRVACHFEHVRGVKRRGDSADGAPLNILAVGFEPAAMVGDSAQAATEAAEEAGADAQIGAEATGGVVILACSGGVEIALEIEALEAYLTDQSQPWRAQATPEHFTG